MRKKWTRPVVMALIFVIVMTLLSGCSSESSFQQNQKELAKFPVADITGYDSMKDFSGESMLADVTVRDVADFMARRESFVLFLGYAGCGWCNALIPTLNKLASEEGVRIAYIDTRKKPEWTSNMDIDDYDDFVDIFGEWISEDGEGKKHLYVPMLFFVNKGEVVLTHSGVTPALENPTEEMTEEIVAELEKTLLEKISQVTP